MRFELLDLLFLDIFELENYIIFTYFLIGILIIIFLLFNAFICSYVAF